VTDEVTARSARPRTQQKGASLTTPRWLASVPVAAAILLGCVSCSPPSSPTSSTPPRGTPTVTPATLSACLHAGEPPAHAVPYPATVLIGGSQVLKVDLETGTVTAFGLCRPATQQTPLPVRGARVVWFVSAGGSTRVQLTDRAGNRTVIEPLRSPHHRAWLDGVYVSGRGRLVLAERVNPLKPSHIDSMVTYDATGAVVSSTTMTRGLSPFTLPTRTAHRSFASTNHDLVSLDLRTGTAVHRIVNGRRPVIGWSPRLLAWQRGEGRFRQIPGKPKGLMACSTTCAPIQVTDVVTGRTRSYPGSASGIPYETARFSPDDKLIAFTTIDTPRATVGIVNLHDHLTTTIPVAEHHAALAVAWTPDAQALIIAETTQTTTRLLVWHRNDGTVTTAASLDGTPGSPWGVWDRNGWALQVLDPTLGAWN